MMAPMRELIPFSGDPLDRAGNEKRNPDWVAEKLSAPETRFLPYWKLNPLTTLDDDTRLLWLDRSALTHQDESAQPVLLGMRDGVARRTPARGGSIGRCGRGAGRRWPLRRTPTPPGCPIRPTITHP